MISSIFLKNKIVTAENEHLQDQEVRLQPTQEEEYKPPFRLHKFGYDWRRSNNATTIKFLEFLQNIHSNNGQKPIYVIAHSNGGLITLSALNQQPELFAGCIFAGTLFHGAPGIFHSFKHGNSILFNKRIQDDAANFTLRTIYHFLPMQYDKVFKDSVSGEYLSEFDYFDVDCWKNCRFSNLVSHDDDDSDKNGEDNPRYLELGDKKERTDYLKMVLDDVKSFHETLKLPKDRSISYPPLVTIASDNHATNGGYHVKRDDDGNKLRILYDQPIPVKGDGAVPFTSTRLPDGIPFDAYHSTHSHGVLLQDLVTLGKAIEKVFGKK